MGIVVKATAVKPGHPVRRHRVKGRPPVWQLAFRPSSHRTDATTTTAHVPAGMLPAQPHTSSTGARLATAGGQHHHPPVLLYPCPLVSSWPSRRTSSIARSSHGRFLPRVLTHAYSAIPARQDSNLARLSSRATRISCGRSGSGLTLQTQTAS